MTTLKVSWCRTDGISSKYIPKNVQLQIQVTRCDLGIKSNKNELDFEQKQNQKQENTPGVSQ